MRKVLGEGKRAGRALVLLLSVVVLAGGIMAYIQLGVPIPAHGEAVPEDYDERRIYEGTNAWNALLTDAFNDMRARATEAGVVRGLLRDVLGFIEGEGSGEGEGTYEGFFEGEGEGYRPSRCRIYLTGSQVVPPAVSDARGWAELVYLPEQGQLILDLQHTVEQPTGIYLCAGAPGENGAILLDLGDPRSPARIILGIEDVALLLEHEAHHLLITSEYYVDGEVRGDGYCDLPNLADPLSSLRMGGARPERNEPSSTSISKNGGEGEGEDPEPMIMPLCSFALTENALDPQGSAEERGRVIAYMDLVSGSIYISVTHDVVDVLSVSCYAGPVGEGGTLLHDFGNLNQGEVTNFNPSSHPQVHFVVSSVVKPDGEIAGTSPLSCVDNNQAIQSCEFELTGHGFEPASCSNESAVLSVMVNGDPQTLAMLIQVQDLNVANPLSLVARDLAAPSENDLVLVSQLSGTVPENIQLAPSDVIAIMGGMQAPALVITSTNYPDGAVGVVPDGSTCFTAFPSVVRVDDDSTAVSPDGNSWSSAFSSIQDAVDYAAGMGGGEVWVAEGIYADLRENTPCLTALNLQSNVDVLGGFDTADDSREERDWHQNPTMILGRNAEIEGAAEHVVRGIGLHSAVLDGFIIAGGHATGLCEGTAQGGGIYLEDPDGDVVLRNLTVILNIAAGQVGNQLGAGRGAGLFVRAPNSQTGETSVKIQSCRFLNNWAVGEGGGIYLGENVSPSIENCLIAGNSSNLLLFGNQLPTLGGGVYLESASTARSHFITGSTFVGNSAGEWADVYAEVGVNTPTLSAIMADSDGGATNVGADYTLSTDPVAGLAPQLAQPEFLHHWVGIADCYGDYNSDQATQVLCYSEADADSVEALQPKGKILLLTDAEQSGYGMRPHGVIIGHNAASRELYFLGTSLSEAAPTGGMTYAITDYTVARGAAGIDTGASVPSNAPVDYFGTVRGDHGAGPQAVYSACRFDRGYFEHDNRQDTFVYFEDAKLQQAVYDALVVINGGNSVPLPLRPENLDPLQMLFIEDSDIFSLTGLEHAGNLTTLDASGNEGLDIRALRQHPSLEIANLGNCGLTDADQALLPDLLMLNLEGNAITNLDFLDRMSNLVALGLGDNPLADLSELAGLPTSLDILAVHSLGLTSNDLSYIGHLTNLTELYLDRNAITWLPTWSLFDGLAELNLRENGISDITQLAGSSISNANIKLEANPLDPTDDGSFCGHIATLEYRHNDVSYWGTCDGDDYILTTVLQGMGDIEPLVGTRPYAAGEVAVINALETTQGVAFREWHIEGADGGVNVSSLPSLTLTMDQDYVVTAVFMDVYTLTVSTQGPGSVNVVVDGENMGTNGSYPVFAGQLVDLLPQPEVGADFVSWSSYPPTSIVDNQFEVVGDVNVTAEFGVFHTVTVTRLDNVPGEVTVSPGEVTGHGFPAGENVSLGPDEHFGYDLVGWQDNDLQQQFSAPEWDSASGVLSLEMSRDYDVSPLFVPAISLTCALAFSPQQVVPPTAVTEAAFLTIAESEQAGYLTFHVAHEFTESADLEFWNGLPGENGTRIYHFPEVSNGDALEVPNAAFMAMYEDGYALLTTASHPAGATRADFRGGCYDHILQVSVEGEGTVSPEEGIHFLQDQEVVQLDATETSPEWKFSYWRNTQSDERIADPEVAFPISSDLTLEAVFLNNYYDLTLVSEPSGAASFMLNPNQAHFAPGQIVTVEAVPSNPLSALSYWRDQIGADDQPGPQLSLTMDSDKSYAAVVLDEYVTLSTAESPVEGGSVTHTPEKNVYAVGAPVTLTGTSAEGWCFDAWSGLASGTDEVLTINLTESGLITGSFVEEVQLTVETVGLGTVEVWREGASTPLPNAATYAVCPGETVTLTAVPSFNPLRGVGEWTNVDSFDGDTATVMMTGARTVSVEFVENNWLSVLIQGDGTVSVNGLPEASSYTFDVGETITATATAGTGSAFTGWEGPLTGESNPDSFVINAHEELIAHFDVMCGIALDVAGGFPAPIDVVSSPAPPVSAQQGMYVSGSEVSLTAHPVESAGVATHGFAYWDTTLALGDPESPAVTVYLECSGAPGQVETLTAVYSPVVTTLHPALEAYLVSALGKMDGLITQYDLENLTGLFSLNDELASVTHLNGLEHCTNLATLHLEDTLIADISSISTLPNLELLWLTQCPLESLPSSLQCPNLRTVHIVGTEIYDITPLSQLPALSYLLFSGDDVTDITPLESLEALESVRLISLPIDRLDPLAKLAENPDSALTSLHISGLQDLRPYEFCRTIPERIEANGVTVTHNGECLINTLTVSRTGTGQGVVVVAANAEGFDDQPDDIFMTIPGPGNPQVYEIIAGMNAILEAVPASGSAFTGWKLPGSLVSSGDDSGPHALQINGSMEEVARFDSLHPYTLTADGDGSLAYSPSRDSSGTVPPNQTVSASLAETDAMSLQATASDASIEAFSHWESDLDSVNGVLSREASFVVQGPGSISGIFAPCLEGAQVPTEEFDGMSLPTGWETVLTPVDGAGIVLDQTNGFLSNGAGAVGSDTGVLAKVNPHVNFEASFSAYFASGADANQAIVFRPRHVSDDETIALTLAPDGTDNVSLVARTGGQETLTVSESFGFSRDTWYAVFVRSLGNVVQVWIRPASEVAALPWGDYLRYDGGPPEHLPEPPLVESAGADVPMVNAEMRLEMGLVDDTGAWNPDVLRFDDLALTVYPCDVFPVPFADPALEAAVQSALGIGATPVPSDVFSALSSLDVHSAGIHSLQGIEFAEGLQSLNAANNHLISLSPLGYLSAVQVLDFSDNSLLSDLAPLSTLASLRALQLARIAGGTAPDIDPLGSTALSGLQTLDLSGNLLESASLLAFRHDTRPWALNAIQVLTLSNNNVADISQLSENPNLGFGATVHLIDNPLSTAAICSHIPALVSRGASVMFDDTTASFTTLSVAVSDGLDGLTGGQVGFTPSPDTYCGLYDPSEEVTLTATADPCWRFVEWTGDIGGAVATDNPITVTMDVDRTIHGVFELKSHELVIEASWTPSNLPGTYDGTPSIGAHDYSCGTAVPLTASASGYEFDGWSGAIDPEATEVLVDGDKSIVANFTKLHTLTTSVAGEGAILSSPSNDPAIYRHGTSVTLTPAASACWQFDSWSGDALGTTQSGNELTVPMDSDRSITAAFTQIPYTLTIDATWTPADPPGTYTGTPPLGANSVLCGEVVPLNPMADGYAFDGWTGDLTALEDEITIDGDKSISAAFTKTYTLTVNAAHSTVEVYDGEDVVAPTSTNSWDLRIDREYRLIGTRETGYVVSHWENEDRVPITTYAELEYTATEDRTLTLVACSASKATLVVYAPTAVTPLVLERSTSATITSSPFHYQNELGEAWTRTEIFVTEPTVLTVSANTSVNPVTYYNWQTVSGVTIEQEMSCAFPLQISDAKVARLVLGELPQELGAAKVVVDGIGAVHVEGLNADRAEPLAMTIDHYMGGVVFSASQSLSDPFSSYWTFDHWEDHAGNILSSQLSVTSSIAHSALDIDGDLEVTDVDAAIVESALQGTIVAPFDPDVDGDGVVSQVDLDRISLANRNHILRAVFAPSITYEVVTGVSPTSSGHVYTDMDTYGPGQVAKVSAVPAEGFLFSHWTGNPVVEKAKFSVLMDGDKSLTAHFRIDDRPVLALNGSAEVYLEGDEVFLDPGVTAFDIDGNDLSNQVHITRTYGIPEAGWIQCRYSVADAVGREAVPVYRHVRIGNAAVLKYREDIYQKCNECNSDNDYKECYVQEIEFDFGGEPFTLYRCIPNELWSDAQDSEKLDPYDPDVVACPAKGDICGEECSYCHDESNVLSVFARVDVENGVDEATEMDCSESAQVSIRQLYWGFNGYAFSLFAKRWSDGYAMHWREGGYDPVDVYARKMPGAPSELSFSHWELNGRVQTTNTKLTIEYDSKPGQTAVAVFRCGDTGEVDPDYLQLPAGGVVALIQPGAEDAGDIRINLSPPKSADCFNNIICFRGACVNNYGKYLRTDGECWSDHQEAPYDNFKGPVMGPLGYVYADHYDATIELRITDEENYNFIGWRQKVGDEFRCAKGTGENCDTSLSVDVGTIDDVDTTEVFMAAFESTSPGDTCFENPNVVTNESGKTQANQYAFHVFAPQKIGTCRYEFYAEGPYFLRWEFESDQPQTYEEIDFTVRSFSVVLPESIGSFVATAVYEDGWNPGDNPADYAARFDVEVDCGDYPGRNSAVQRSQDGLLFTFLAQEGGYYGEFVRWEISSEPPLSLNLSEFSATDPMLTLDPEVLHDKWRGMDFLIKAIYSGCPPEVCGLLVPQVNAEGCGTAEAQFSDNVMACEVVYTASPDFPEVPFLGWFRGAGEERVMVSDELVFTDTVTAEDTLDPITAEFPSCDEVQSPEQDPVADSCIVDPLAELEFGLADPVLWSTGAVFRTETDILVPGIGLDLEWTRKYLSRGAREDAIGYSWDHSYNIYLERASSGDGTDIVMHGGLHRVEYYQDQGDGTWIYGERFDQLEKLGAQYVLTMPSGGKWVFEDIDSSTPKRGKLLSMADRYGNTIALAYDDYGKLETITDTLGNVLTIHYSAGRLQRLVLTHGNDVLKRIRYEYGIGQTNGDLKEVYEVSRENPSNELLKESYKYYPNTHTVPELHHNLKSATRRRSSGNEIEYVQIEYGVSGYQKDRMTRQEWGGALDVVNAVYYPADDTSNEGPFTVINDRNGNVIEMYFDQRNLLQKKRVYAKVAQTATDPTYASSGLKPDGTGVTLANRPGDENSFETSYDWTDERRLKSITRPSGEQLVYEYSSSADRARKGNITHVKVKADASDADPLVTEYGYSGCDCGRISEITDANGKLTTYDYENEQFSDAFSTGYTVTTVPPGQAGNAAYHRVEEYDTTGRLIRVTHPANDTLDTPHSRVDKYVYSDAFAVPDTEVLGPIRLVEITLNDEGQDKVVRTVAYDRLGRLVGIEIPRSVWETGTFREGGAALGISPGSKIIYDGYGRIEKVIESLGGPQATYVVDAYTYYDDGLPHTRTTNEYGHSATVSVPTYSAVYSFDALGALERVTESLSTGPRISNFAYDGNRNLVATWFGAFAEPTADSENNHVETYDYNTRNLLAERIVGFADDDNAVKTTYMYDADGRLTTVFPSNDSAQTSTLKYDPHGRLESVEMPENVTQKYKLDRAGNVLRVGTLGPKAPGEAAKLLSLTTFGIDDLYRVGEVAHLKKDAAQAASVFDTLVLDDTNAFRITLEYAPFGAPSSRSTNSGYGDSVSYKYDELYRVEETADAVGNKMNYMYTARSFLEKVTSTAIASDDPNIAQTYETTTNRDHVGRVYEVTDAGNRTGTVELDRFGNPLLTNLPGQPLNMATTYAYDEIGRLLSRSTPVEPPADTPQTVAFAWDQSSRLQSATDPAGIVTNYIYNARSQLEEIKLPHHGAGAFYRKMIYDPLGRVESVEDTKGNKMSYTSYDNLNRPTVVQVLEAQSSTASGDLTYSYDGLSRIVEATVGAPTNVTVARTYDTLSNMLTDTITHGGFSDTTTRTADGFGNTTSLAYPSGQSGYSYRYNASVSRVGIDEGLMSPFTNERDFAYLGRGRMRSGELAEGLRFDWDYDASGRLDTLGFEVGAEPPGGGDLTWSALYELDYDWTDRGNVDQLTTSSDAIGADYDWAYDNLSRRTELNISGRPAQVQDAVSEFEYFPDGSLKRFQDADVAEFLPNELSDPSSEFPHVYDSFTYSAPAKTEHHEVVDDNGNRVSFDTVPSTVPNEGYRYEAHNRLAAYTDASGALTTYTYDAFGRRVLKDQGGTVTRYAYDGWNVIEEYDGSHTLQRAYKYGRGLDDVLSMTLYSGPDAGTYHYIKDAANTVHALVDDTGAVVERYTYDPNGGLFRAYDGNWENPTSTSGIGNPYLFQGRRLDTESGLYYYRYRYFDPITGRFLTPDPIGIWGDGANVGNPYTGMGNNLASKRDPYGLLLDGLFSDLWQFYVSDKFLGTGYEQASDSALDQWFADANRDTSGWDPLLYETWVLQSDVGNDLLLETYSSTANDVRAYVALSTLPIGGSVGALIGALDSGVEYTRQSASLGTPGLLLLGAIVLDAATRGEWRSAGVLDKIGDTCQGGANVERRKGVLGRNLVAAGYQATEGWEAHHIVPLGYSYLRDVRRARQILHHFRIDLDSATNGVWLPGPSINPETVNAVPHKNIHRRKYFYLLRRFLETAATREEAVDILQSIAGDLAEGGVVVQWID